MAHDKRVFEARDLKVMVHVDDARMFTTVILTGSRFTGVGVAKRNPRDTYDPTVGFDIASARALRELADETERNAGLEA